MNTRTVAKLTGYSLILMALTAGFSLGYAFPKIYSPGQLDIAQSNLTGNLQLYKLMLVGILLVLLLDLLVSWTLYVYFKTNNEKLALMSGVLRVIYSFIFGVATFYLFKNIGELNDTLVIQNYTSFQNIWSIGLAIFGTHLLAVGMLMKLHRVIPVVFWSLTLIAGASYILIHVLKTGSPQLTELSNTLNNILALPMALGELGLAAWLIVQGGKDKINLMEKTKSQFTD